MLVVFLLCSYYLYSIGSVLLDDYPWTEICVVCMSLARYKVFISESRMASSGVVSKL